MGEVLIGIDKFWGNCDGASLLGKLDGIWKQVQKNLLESLLIGENMEIVTEFLVRYVNVDSNLHCLVFTNIINFLNSWLYAEFGAIFPKLPCLQLSKIKQIVYQKPEYFCTRAQDLHTLFIVINNAL